MMASIGGKGGFLSTAVSVMLEFLLSSEIRQLFGAVSSKDNHPHSLLLCDSPLNLQE